MLLTKAQGIAAIDAEMARALPSDVIQRIVNLIPEGWMEEGAPDRTAYNRYLVERLTSPRAFVEEAVRAR